MTTVVAFLRAINVGGRYLTMPALAAHVQSLGVAGARTFINSGNVLFETRVRELSRLEAQLEDGLEPLLGFRAEVFLRTAAEVHAIARQAEQLRGRLADGWDATVAFLRTELTPEQQGIVATLRTERDDFVLSGRELVWLCQGDTRDSRFSNAVLERRLRLRSTFRRARMLERLSQQLQSAD